MKTYQTTKKSFFLIGLLIALFAGKAFSEGTNDYNVCIRNIRHVSSQVIELDIWMEWTGTNTQKFEAFQGGLDFNYDGLANGGTIAGMFVPGSADAALPAAQQNPNWNVNSGSKQIRFLAAVATPAATAVSTPAPPGFRLGTLRLTNTVPFKEVPMNFAWSLKTGSNATTQSREMFYLNGSSTGTTFSDVKNKNMKSVRVAEGGGCRLTNSNEVEKLSKLTAYPNPTSGKIKLSFATETKSKFNITITDLTGHVAMTDVIYSAMGENTKDLDLSGLAKGMYFITMETEGTNAQSVVPVVIQQ
jgi:hypothetical protein